jgi:hypothetical protein
VRFFRRHGVNGSLQWLRHGTLVSVFLLALPFFLGGGCSPKEDDQSTSRAPATTESADRTAGISQHASAQKQGGFTADSSRPTDGPTPFSSEPNDAERQIIKKVVTKLHSLPNVEDKLKWLRLVLDMCQRESLRLPIAAEALADADPAIRCGTIRLLARYDVGAMAPAFEASLRDPCEEVRLAAVSALKSQSGPVVASLLVQAANDDSATVRRAAVLDQKNTPDSPPL